MKVIEIVAWLLIVTGLVMIAYGLLLSMMKRTGG